jgi:ADP-ribose pyrophosphatase YjhB (NUDIX family)
MTAHRPSNLVRAIAPREQSRRQWRVELDGQLVPSPSLVEITSRYGILRYGWCAGGYDAWSFSEVGRGGVIAIPFAIKDGALLVGVIEEFRHNQGGVVLNVPRGLIEYESGETPAAAASRELAEETGISGATLLELSGVPVNANSAFFETPAAGDGTRIYALELAADWLVADADGVRVREDHLDNSLRAVQERARERIGTLRLVPWTEAAALSDLFTVAAVARLVATLHRAGRWP